MKPETKELLKRLKLKSPAALFSRLEHLRQKGLISTTNLDILYSDKEQVAKLMSAIQLQQESN